MPPRRRTGRRIFSAFLPVILLLALVLVAITGWLVYGATRPPRQEYLVTPEKFTQLSGPGLKATEETWTNRDGTRETAKNLKSLVVKRCASALKTAPEERPAMGPEGFGHEVL